MLSRKFITSYKLLKFLSTTISTALIIVFCSTIYATDAITPIQTITVSKDVKVFHSTKSNQNLESAEIQRVVKTDLNKIAGKGVVPEIGDVFIADSYAVANWILGEGGGQAILIKKQTKWQLLARGGGAVSDSYLRSLGVPQEQARKLIGLINKKSN